MEPENKISSTDEIEITSEMIDAGEMVLLETLGGGVSCHWWPRDLAISVYRAMIARSVSSSRP